MKIFTTATASAVLALAIGANAVAADVTTTNSGFRTPGISLVERGGRSGLKDLVVQAGTDPGTVELHFAGAQKITFGDVGMLIITRADGSIWRYKPSVYQVVDGKRRPLIAGFHFMGKDRVSLKVDKYDSSAPLVIGPVSGRNS
ncbi:MAG: hypothetical protein QOJ99_5580 [Bryobacterales bacterium]|nr:hypothetical protein [Bryobacterales bacterium]